MGSGGVVLMIAIKGYSLDVRRWGVGGGAIGSTASTPEKSTVLPQTFCQKV